MEALLGDQAQRSEVAELLAQSEAPETLRPPEGGAENGGSADRRRPIS